ncbi:hypothetical protein B0T26DRAFT_677503 [Lasiosphaeria miniovina]|uniref:DUF676 domain-containing protein n=1 Tax=Lasiosphaeria miniovina TaxID=1954250 RepID=A0AA40ACF2_9PEZI|nr:uncharacterized protein B0T26DRAFT_677503 [Lasiosphaeria miniovina]KAK0713128.1 hypothetical protein B0T26DRAFT_677503 [Lasiosphaeria miniovina]
MGSIDKDISRYELTAVYRHPAAKADIVLVHGLNGDPEKTWLSKNGVFWPSDLLPVSLKNEHANVLVYGYNADVYSTRRDRSPSDNFVHQHAQSLVTSLTQYRKSEGTERNPIIWVAHSLGGIVTKRALLYSNDVRAHHQEDFRSIFVSTYGIIFLGTPHNGSDLAMWGRVLQYMSDAIIPRKFFETESVLIRTLKKDNETLQLINSHFLDIYQRFRIHMVHENHTTDVKGTKVLIVDASSAGPQLPGVTYYGIEATHSGMCKFDSDHAPGYRNISTAIREWVADGPNVIPVRWEVEEDDRRLRADLENFERTRPYPCPPALTVKQSPVETAAPVWVPSVLPETAALVRSQDHRVLETSRRRQDEPLFIHPESFRPNSFFIGREDELRGLHDLLMDRKRRSEGTSAVLVQCLPGGGKTHLARQYVFQHKDDYPGGVYWVRAKSRDEMEYWYWRIAKNEALKGLVEQEDVEELRDPKRIVEIVRRWLSSQSGWLMVLDGIQFDIPGLHEFIPDARDTSLIYTSTERAVTGDPRFDNPQVMELGLLTAQQAQDLLFLEMDKKRPWTTDDRIKALELVQLMGRLPLMIHIAAQYLKATREPLSRYLKSYQSRPKVGGLPAYKAVREQLEHRGRTAALNLMSLLAFFDQHVPVGMVTLGLSALDKITPVKTADASHRKTTLSNTLKVLIAFALVERTESDDISPSSSRSSRQSFDKHADYLDLLRIHSVVQAFFVDTLNEHREVPFWLERATAIWSRSFDEADKRIREDPRVGLPDDYRRFCIHGQKLLQHLNRFEKRSPELLSRARAEVESRLEKIQGQIDCLSQAVQAYIVDGSGEEPPASVFDRSSNISSETDSAATLPSGDSRGSQTSWEVDADEPEQPLPAAYEASPTEPSDWQVPYPSKLLMPPTPDIDDDGDQNTVASSPPWTPPVGGNTMTTIHVVDNTAPYLDDRVGSQDYEDWQEVVPHHRVIKRHESRRYHDRAGAWRDSTVSDPRVGISQEIAVGSISSRIATPVSPSKGRVTARSDAEMELNKIKQASPLPPPEPMHDTSGANLSRPQYLLGRGSYSQALAKKTPETEFEMLPAEFSKGLIQVLSSPKTWTVATVKKLKESVLPSLLPTDPAPLAAASVSQTQTAYEDDIIVPPGPIFRGNRTANSSPASRLSPFQPPTFSALPAEAVADELAHHPGGGLPLVIRRWDTTVHHPGMSRVDSSGVEEWIDPLSFSYPSVLPRHDHRRQQHHTYGGAGDLALQHRAQQQSAQHAWIRPGLSGYSSQPMTPTPSHRSSSIVTSGGPLHDFAQVPSSPGSASFRYRTPATHHSSPLAGTSPDNMNSSKVHHPAAGSGATRLPFPSSGAASNRRRRLSCTETEPSPRLDAAFPDVDTSYRRWEQLQQNRPAATSTSSSPSPAIAPGNFARQQQINLGNQSRAAARSQSHSPSPSRSRIPLPSVQAQQHHAPHHLLAFAIPQSPKQNHQHFEHQAETSNSACASPSPRPLPPAAAAGILVSDGHSIVEFSSNNRNIINNNKIGKYPQPRARSVPAGPSSSPPSPPAGGLATAAGAGGDGAGGRGRSSRRAWGRSRGRDRDVPGDNNMGKLPLAAEAGEGSDNAPDGHYSHLGIWE